MLEEIIYFSPLIVLIGIAILLIADYLRIAFWNGIYMVPLYSDISDLYINYKQNLKIGTKLLALIFKFIFVFVLIPFTLLSAIGLLTTWNIILFIYFISAVIVIIDTIFLHPIMCKAILKHRMKKRIHSEEQKEKIQYINVLERKLNYIEGFETEVSKIKPKLKSSNNIEEIEKDINALEIKINIRDNILNIINEVISQSKR